MSQSPLIGAFVPADNESWQEIADARSQSPLIGAFVPANLDHYRCKLCGEVAIPSDRGIRSGKDMDEELLERIASRNPL